MLLTAGMHLAARDVRCRVMALFAWGGVSTRSYSQQMVYCASMLA